MSTIASMFHRITIRLPLGVGNTVWKYSVVLAWASLVYTIIATLYELTVFNHMIAIAIAQFEAVGAYLRNIDQFLHQLSRGWDVITDPLVAWINRLDIPYIEYVSRFSVVLTLLVPSALRYAGHRLLHRRDAAEVIKGQKKIQQAEAQLAEAERSGSDSDSAGAGAVILAIIGGLIGSVAGPVGIAAGVAAGGILGAAGDGAAGAGGDATAAERARGALSALLPIQESLEERERRSVGRVRQARTLLVFSAVTALVLGAAILADIFFYDGRNRCFTVQDVGSACSCLASPERIGEAVRPSGASASIPERLEGRRFQNICVLND